MVIFETHRLILRQFTEADAPLVLALNSDPAVLQYLHEPVLEDEEHARRIIRDIILPQYQNRLGRWAAFTKESQEFIGWCGLKHRPELGEIDLGYRFKQSAWGKGYATETAAAALQYGFTHLGLREITGRADVGNLASLRVLEKIGMQYVRDEVIDDCPVKTYTAKNPA
jgi:RimJ/RimL family protein N-acetyltransferase